jgi:hypothetical protein
MHNFRLHLFFLILATSIISKAQTNDIRQLTLQLDSIYEADQKYRQQYESTYQQYGATSVQLRSLFDIMVKTDSVNLRKVKFILDRYGWLGADQVGEQGNATLFLVIQHSDKETRAKYLPMMREAVKNKKASPQDLAKLEDRTALEQGRKQLYGTQLRRDKQTHQFYLSPLEDPENVNKRRAEVGLPSIEESLTEWGIRWNLEEYKKTQAETNQN